MTARQLAARLADAGVTVAHSRGRVALSGPPPADLLPAVRVLKSGLAAVATGRRWWRCRRDDGHWEQLSVDARLPADVTLVAVEGDGWDRVPAAARLDCPDLFAAEPAETQKADARRAA